MAELFLVRHGQASLGTDNYDQLSDKGYQQADLLAEYFNQRNVQFDGFISGDMQRHKQTIEPSIKSIELEIDKGWNEFDFEAVIKGYLKTNPEHQDALGEDKRELYRLLKTAMMAWAAGGIDDTLPETWETFTQRVQTSAKSLLSRKEKRLLVVSSGGAIAAFMGMVLNLPSNHIVNLNLQIKNASVHHFFFNKHGFQLNTFNSVSHLDSVEHQKLITYS